MSVATVGQSVSIGQSIAFSAYGLLLKQKEVVTVTEYRGYDSQQDAVTAANGMFSDTTGQTNLYHATEGGGFVMASVISGTLVTAVASRVNEAGMWHVVKTETVYTWTAPSIDSGWSTTRPATGNGFTSGIGRAKRVLTEVQGYPLYATESTTSQEWRGCTAQEANNLINSCPADSLTTHTYKCTRIATVIGRFDAQSGTRYSTESHYISETEGYSVSRHTTTITVSGANWSLEQ